MTKEEKEEFIRVRNYFNAYFDNKPLPPEEVNLEELEAKWRRQERILNIKEKLRLRRNKRQAREQEQQNKLAQLLNLREVDCCNICNNNKAVSIDYVCCKILPNISLDINQLCDKFKV